MKRFLAAGYDKIFQVGPCFRKGERGEHHLPEFMLLEWYRAQEDYRAMADDCEQLVVRVSQELFGRTSIDYQGESIDLDPPWPRVTVQEVFIEHAGWDPMREETPERFEQDLSEKVIPGLDKRSPVLLLDFPAYEASLARTKPEDPRVAERVELFAGGLELANGFSELREPEEQRRRFEETNRRRTAAGQNPLPLPEKFLAFLSDLPPSAGIAMGIDRLVMLLTGASRIDDVIALAPEDL
jgi:lysyl-tRNA synthetase class 2